MGDRGDTSIQMAILFPFVITLTLIGIQSYTWAHAREIARVAAREGVQVGRGYQSSPGEGAGQARSVLTRLAGDNLRGASVSTAGSTPQRVRIAVSGSAPSLVPFLDGLHVSASAAGPTERWTQRGDAQ